MELILIISLILGSIILILTGFKIGKKTGELLNERKWKKELPKIRADATKRSRAVLSGQFSEQLAPFLPDFQWKPTEARFIGKPIDFLIFKGIDEKKISEVVFVEVKSGSSQLSTVEKSLKQAIKEGKVSWKEYRIPENLTKKT